MFKRLFLLVIVLLSFASADKPMFAYEPHPIKGLDASRFNGQGDLKYAYAPSTVYYDHKFHQFYCSTGGASDNFFNPKGKLGLEKSFDHIRYRTSKDGSNWSAPRIVLTVNERSNAVAGPNDDLCACDPAVVYGDDGYWYMLYGSNNKKNGSLYDAQMSLPDTIPLVIYLARARFVQGPYFKYTDKGREDEIHDASILKASKPKIVLGNSAKDWVDDKTGTQYRLLGAAQPTIIRKDNKFYVWYRSNLYTKEKTGLCRSSDEMCYKLRDLRFLFVTVNKLTDLPQKEKKFYGEMSYVVGEKLKALVDNKEKDMVGVNEFHGGYSIFDVRYDMADNDYKFKMWTAFRYLIRGQKIKKFESRDGINWRFVKDEDLGSYNYIHNAGVAGDAFGAVRNGKYLISFSAPYSVVGNPEVAIDWSDAVLRDSSYNIEDHRDRDSTLKGSWGMWQQLVGKKWDTTSVKYSSSGFKLDSKISATNTRYFTGDFDGDGISDLGAVDCSSRKCYWYEYSSRGGKYIIKGDTLDGRMKASYEVVVGDFDGDGKTDVGAVDTANGQWYIHSSRTDECGVGSSPSMPNYIPCGWPWGGMNSSHKVVVGDYNGDGIADRAIYNGSNWFIISSLATDSTVAGGFFTVRGGANNFIPWGWTWEWSTGDPMNGNAMVVAGDFDGDGITDRAVYEKNSGAWTSLSTRADALMAVTWRWQNGNPALPLWRNNFIGSIGLDHRMTTPVVGDYDGDGVDDLVHVGHASGKWFYFSSLEGKIDSIGDSWTAWENTAASNRTILVGDFDGDGKMDPAFVDKAERKFYVRSSRTGGDGIDRTIKYVSYNPNNGYFRKIGADPIDDKKPVVPEAPSMNVAVEGRKVTVTNVEYGSKVAVFDMLGKRVLEAPAGMNAAIFEVPSYGKFIVRSGAQSRVIMVK